MMTTDGATGTETRVDREQLRAGLLDAQRAYHALLASLSDADWRAKSANPAWSVGQLMWHLALGTGFIASEAEAIRAGKGRNPPQFLVNPVNVLWTRLGSRGATPTSVAEKYDAGMTRLLAAFDGVRDDEWGRGARRYGHVRTLAMEFQAAVDHVAEHGAQVREGIGRA